MRGDPFQVGGDVGGEEHGAHAVGDGLEHGLQKPPPGDGIEARHRFVEDQHLRPVAEGEHEGELLLLAN